MIASGEKKEEYREIKGYWASRLLDYSEYPKELPDDTKTFSEDICCDFKNGHDMKDVLKSYWANYKNFDRIIFKNGYQKDAPTMVFECKGIETDKGNPNWGAKENEHYLL